MKQYRWCVWVVCLALLFGARPGHAAIGQVEGLSWVEYPVLEHQEGAEADLKVFPDWDEAALIRAEYVEQSSVAGPTAGFITCQTRDDACLTVLYYSPQGKTFPVVRQLPVPARQATTLTIEYDDTLVGGVVRLVVWQGKPASGWIELLATQPNWQGEAVPGLTSERWFSRPKKAATGPLPWIDPWREVLSTPMEFQPAPWPDIQAYIASDFVTIAKDCAILFDGTPAFAQSQTGTSGLWPLHWGVDLTLVFEVGEVKSLSEVKLYLLAKLDTQQSPLGYPSADQLLEIMVNGRWVPAYEYSSAFGNVTQPITVSLSQYLQQGENRVRIRVNAFSTGGLDVSEIVLWAR